MVAREPTIIVHEYVFELPDQFGVTVRQLIDKMKPSMSVEIELNETVYQLGEITDLIAVLKTAHTFAIELARA